MKVEVYVNGTPLKCGKIACKTRKIAWRSALAARKRFENTARFCRQFSFEAICGMVSPLTHVAKEERG
jgi:hypothetical protein